MISPRSPIGPLCGLLFRTHGHLTLTVAEDEHDYSAEDLLGSSRAIVQAGQTSLRYDADFYPFGGERCAGNGCVPVVLDARRSANTGKPISPNRERLLCRGGGGPIILVSRLHDDATITAGNSASYQFWSGKSTEEIIQSLKLGSEYVELTVRPNETEMNGNTRAKILEVRGFDVNKLVRVIEDIPEIPEP